MRAKADIRDKIMDKTLATLESLKIFEVSDLHVLRNTIGFDGVFSRVTAKKIADALDAFGMSLGTTALAQQRRRWGM